MQDFLADELHIRAHTTPGLLRLDWTGKSNSRDPGKLLLPYFDRVLNQALAENGAVQMHFEKLEYFNSSTIAALIQMINAAQEKKVKLELTYDAKLRWQTLSFDALRRAIRPFQATGTSTVDFKTV